MNSVSRIIVLLLFAVPISAQEVNIYSGRKGQLIKPLLDKFSQQTGITVNLTTAKDDAIIKKLELEGNNSPADILITTDAGRLYRAKQVGVLQPVKSNILEQSIQPYLRDPQNYWFGLTVRARPIMYRKDTIQPSQLSSYEDLADIRWQGQICIRSSNNIYNQSLIASMIATNGVVATEKWAQKFVGNFARPPKGGDRDQIKAAAAGVCNIVIANTYYLAGMILGKDETQQKAAAKMAIFWPNQKDRGVHINISGIAITKSAKNKANAKRLLEYMVTEDAQIWYAQANGEYPVVKDTKTTSLLSSWGEFKADSINLSKLGKYNAEAVRLMDRVGWK